MRKWIAIAAVANINIIFLNAVDQKGKVRGSEVVSGIESLYLDDADGIVAVGVKVSDAMRKLHMSHYLLPHPSGRNRKFNMAKYEMNVINGLRNFLTEPTRN